MNQVLKGYQETLLVNWVFVNEGSHLNIRGGEKVLHIDSKYYILEREGAIIALHLECPPAMEDLGVEVPNYKKMVLARWLNEKGSGVTIKDGEKVIIINGVYHAVKKSGGIVELVIEDPPSPLELDVYWEKRISGGEK